MAAGTLAHGPTLKLAQPGRAAIATLGRYNQAHKKYLFLIFFTL